MRRGVGTTTEYTLADQERMKAARRYFEWQARVVEAGLGRRVLEVGCGVGNFSQHLRERDLVVGVDADSACVAEWRRRFNDRPNYRGFVMNAETEKLAECESFGCDSIVCLNVLEHIEDHEGVLRRMWGILPDGGRVVLLVPAFESLYGEIDARLGHFRRYTRGTLSAVAKRAGFEVERLRYMNAIGFFGWWANAKVFKRSEQSPAQIAIFDKYVVPVQAWAEERVPPPFGQSLVATLVKNVLK